MARRAGAMAAVTLLLFAGAAFFSTSGPFGTAGGFRAAAAPLGEYAGRLSFTLSGIDPVVTTAASANQVSVTGRYTNTGPDPIDNLAYRFQRGSRLATVAAVHAEAAQPSQPVAVINPTFHPLPGTIAPHHSADFSVSVPVTGFGAESLGITEPGVYPVMININGTVHTAGGNAQARVGEAHILLTVASLPGTVATAPTRSAPALVGILWPLVDSPHLGLDGVFRNDDLAAEIRPGGRLANSVAMLAASNASPDLVTLAIDPMLLDELNRMSRGYWVSASPNSPQPALRPSTTRPTAGPAATPTSSPTSSPTDTGTAGPSGPSGVPAGPADGASAAGPLGSAGSTGPMASAGSAASGASGAQPPSTMTPSVTGSSAPAGAAGDGGVGASGAQMPSPQQTAQQSDSPATQQTTQQAEQSTQQPTPQAAPSTQLPQPPDTVAGTGAAAAAAFLAQLRSLATTHAVLVLPYGDPDVVALTRAGMAEDIATAVYRGRAVAASVLGQQLDRPGAASNVITDVAAPPGGTLTDEAWQVLQSLGYTSAILSPSGVNVTGKSGTTTGFVTVAVQGDEVPAVVSGGGNAAAFASVLESGAPANWASAVNTLAAVTMVAGTSAPMVVVPPRTFAPHGSGFLALATALDDLSLVGMVLPMPVTAMARGGESNTADGSARALATAPQTAVTLNYTAQAQAAELPTWYLSRLQRIQQHLDVLGQTLSGTATGPDPADILTPLSDSLLGAVSTAWRGHVDPDAAALHSVEATTALLYGGVTIARDTGSYTLASSTAPLLLTVSNTLPYQVTMTVRIIGGEQAGLAAQDPGRIVIGPGPRSTPVRIHSVVSRSGTFTVYAQLQGADGAEWGQSVPLRIDSRAYGALTVVLMAAAGGVLLLMVIWRLLQRRRGRGDDGDRGDDRDDTADVDSADDGAGDGADDRVDDGAGNGRAVPGVRAGEVVP